MDFAFNSSQVFISLFSLITSIGLLIATWKYWLIRVSYKGHGNFGFKLNQRTKYGQYDVFTCRSILLQLGLLFSLASVVVIISWTSYDAREVKVPEIYELIDLIEKLRMTQYLDYKYHEIMFHQMVTTFPSFSIN